MLGLSVAPMKSTGRILPTPEVNQAGQEDSIKNGFDDSESNVTVTINYPYTWQGVSGYVEAIVSETEPTYFARVFNQNNVTVRSRAVAGMGNYNGPCVIALDPTAAKAMTIRGTVNFDVNCEIEVHSENPRGLIISGSSVCMQSAGVGVVGGYRVNGNLDPDCFKDQLFLVTILLAHDEKYCSISVSQGSLR